MAVIIKLLDIIRSVNHSYNNSSFGITILYTYTSLQLTANILQSLFMASCWLAF